MLGDHFTFSVEEELGDSLGIKMGELLGLEHGDELGFSR